jgi:phage-related protein
MEVVYFHARIEDFINCLDGACSEHFFKSLAKLEAVGHSLRMPHSKSLGNGLFELRVPSNPQIRAVFGYYYGKAVIVHIFFKKTMSIPKHELDHAYRVWKNLIA